MKTTTHNSPLSVQKQMVSLQNDCNNESNVVRTTWVCDIFGQLMK
jgi:hypothetical protein